jgi:hypothetical protein
VDEKKDAPAAANGTSAEQVDGEAEDSDDEDNNDEAAGAAAGAEGGKTFQRDDTRRSH